MPAVYHSTALGALSLFAFVCAAVFSAREAIQQYGEDRQGLYAWWKAPSMLPMCLTASFSFRALWVLLRGLLDPQKDWDVEEQIINRFAILFYFTAYAFVVALVMDLVRVQVRLLTHDY